MNAVDREIIIILKDVFQIRRVRPLESDHNTRLWMIRVFFFASIISLLAKAIIYMFDKELDSVYLASVNTPIAIFFTLLFLHINNEVEDTSVIIFVLTWVSLLIGLYL